MQKNLELNIVINDLKDIFKRLCPNDTCHGMKVYIY